MTRDEARERARKIANQFNFEKYGDPSLCTQMVADALVAAHNEAVEACAKEAHNYLHPDGEYFGNHPMTPEKLQRIVDRFEPMLRPALSVDWPGAKQLATEWAELIRLARLGQTVEKGQPNYLRTCQLAMWAETHGVKALNWIANEAQSWGDEQSLYAIRARDALAALPKADG